MTQDRRISTENEPTPIPTPVVAAKPTYIVKRGDVIYQLAFSGRVSPITEEALSFPLDGEISQVYARRGNSVKAGDVLAELDTTTNLVIAYRQAEIKVELAQLELDHARAKAYNPPTADQQYEIDRLTLYLELVQLELDELKKILGDDLGKATRIIAPFDGEIISLSMTAGQKVAANQIVAVIANVSQTEVTASPRESLLLELAEGIAVGMAPAGKPGEEMSGVIALLPYPYGSGGNTKAADSDTAVHIQFDDPQAALARYQLGDLLFITVPITERKNVLWLPPAAIRDFNGRKFVVIQNGDIQQRVDVTLGIGGENRVEILDGLAEGQVVIGQ